MTTAICLINHILYVIKKADCCCHFDIPEIQKLEVIHIEDYQFNVPFIL